MDFFLIRHAPAVDRAEAPTDAVRPLSDRGRRRFRKAVAGMEALDLSLDLVLHSPWRRAVETAELLAPLLSRAAASDPLVATELLAQTPDRALLALMREPPPARLDDGGEAPRANAIALVGHEPWMSELLSLMLTGDRAHADATPFKKGGVAWLRPRAQGERADLVAFLPPRLLRRLGQVDEVIG
ncbi:MAG: phosphohistidine phosphatase SixA [Haliangiales bacterium]